MAAERFVLSTCTTDDVEGMVDVYENSFANNTFSSTMFPKDTITETEKRRWLRTRFLSTFSKPEIRNVKVVEASTGRVAAWARWGFPYKFTEEELAEREKEKTEWPDGSNVEVCEGKFGGLHQKREGHVEKEETYIVYLLSTDPEFQRRGLARKLLQYGIDRADAEGRKVYLEATKDGHPLYLKLGFKDIDLFTMDLSKWGGKELGVSWIMERDPRGSHND